MSYFIGVDSISWEPSSIPAGDRSLTNNGDQGASKFVFGRSSVGSLRTDPFVGWDARIHKAGGDLGLADGAVLQLNASKVLTILRNSKSTNNSILYPGDGSN